MTFETQEIQQLIASFQALAPFGEKDPTLSWLAESGQKWPISWKHPRLSLFWASHGFAQNGTESGALQRCVDGSSGLNRLAEAANSDLRLYEMDLSTPTKNALNGQDAMSEEDMLRSMAYGMMSVEPGLDFLSIGAAGAGTQDSAQALIALHTGTKPSSSIAQDLAKTAHDKRGLEALRAIGGFEIAALCGAIISARLAKIPVLAEGTSGYAAYTLLQSMNAHAVSHVRLAAVTGAPQEALLALPIPVTEDPGVSLAFALSHLRNLAIMSECQTSPQTRSAL